MKTIPRQGWIEKVGIQNPESVADHSYSMSVLAMVLSDLNDLNTEKILKISLIHDLAESLTGDITPDKMSKEEKITIENQAMIKIFNQLPEKLAENYKSLWNEYQENSSLESKFIHDVDRLEMALQAKIYSKEKFPQEALEIFLKSATSEIKSSQLKKILVKLMED